MSDTNTLAKWMRLASKRQRATLAESVGTSVQYLLHIAACRRQPRVALAYAIEQQTREMHVSTRGALPVVTVAELARMGALEGLPMMEQEA